ncbi:hypothetical protein KAT95_00015 [Candidatus Parcubacteria bacterium]|nr:hypothetical protein [Candidatus Parcubacteria bacterium]
MANLFQKFRKFKNNKKIILIIFVIILILAGFGFTNEAAAINYYIQSKLSDTANSVSGWGSASSTSVTSNENENVYGTVVPLTGGDMYATWIKDAAIQGSVWDDSDSRWENSVGTENSGGNNVDAIATGITGMTKNMSAVSDSSGYVHLTYIDSSNYVQYQKYTGSWQTAVALDSTATNEYTTIAIDTAGNNGIYAFWTRDNNIYYRRGCSPYTSTSTDWDSAVTFESAGGNSNDWAVAGYEDFGSGKIFAEWTQGSSSPYDIKWKSATSTACVTGIDISGNIYLANESTLDTTAYTVAVSVNNAEPTTTSTSSGSFQFTSVSVNANDPIAVYIQGHANNDNTFTVTDGTTNIENLHLYLNKTAITNNNSGNTTNANICGFTSYPGSGDNLFTCSVNVPTFTGDEIHIMGSYAPGDDVNTSKMHIVTGGTYTGDTETLTLSGSGTGASRPLFNESGTFTTASSTTKFIGSAESHIQETTYYNLELKPSASATYRLASTGSQTITINNNLTVGNETATSTIDWTTNDPAITLKGNLDLNSPSIWTKSDSATLTWSPEGTKTWSDDNATKQDIGIVSITSGSSLPKIQLSTAVKATTLAVADAHELDLNSQSLNITNGALTTAGTTGIITCAACSAGKTTILGTGNLGGGTGGITFYDLDLGDDTETGTTTAASDFTVSHVLTIDGGANNHAFDASSKTITLSGSGTPFVKNGTFTVSTSTIKYTGTSATNITAVIYNHLEFSPASGTPNYTIQNGTLTVNNNLTIGDGSNGVTLKADSNDPIMTIGNATLTETTTFLIKNAATFVGGSNNITVYGDLTLNSSSTWTKGTGTLILDGGDATYPRYFDDQNGSKQNMGTVQIGTSPAVIKLKSDMTADSLTVSASDTLETQGWDPNIATFVTVNGTLDCTDSGGANNEGNGTTINLGTDWTVAVGATFTAQESEAYPTAVIFDEAAASSVSPGGTDESHDFYNFLVTKSATSTVTLGAAIDVENDLTISNVASTLDVGSNYAINVAGSWSNSGTFTAGTGTVTFDSGDTGETIVSGGTGSGKTFYDIVFNNSAGGWTISTNDLKATHNFNLTDINSAADSFTVASGITVTVQGEFKNDIGGVSTKWTGSTLVLDGSGSYCINTNKNVGDDTYATLQVSAGQYIRMWDSSAATSTISGSLYSMDHAANDGHLHIWGAYSVPSTTTDYWSYLKDFDGAGVSRQSQVTIESSASVTVGSSSESLEIKGNKTASNDKTTVTYAPASGSWNFNNSTGSELIFQEAKIDYMKVNTGIVTALNTVLDDSGTPPTPAAVAILNVDWYVGVHLVDAATTTTDINTGSFDVVISENSSGGAQSTVWKYASNSWGSASTSQETGTGSNGEIPQPEIDDSIRIREYSRTSAGYTFYYYNLHVKWQASYGEYDYYERAGSNKYVISTYYTGGGHDNIINDSGTNDWHREDIDVNNAEPGSIDGPPIYGTWYCGLRPGLEFEIVDSDSDSPPSLEIGTLDSPNYTNTDWVDLKVNTSASNGYIITAWAVSSYTPDIFRHADYPSSTYIQDFIGTYATSTEWGGYCKDNSNYCGFGYTSSDPSVEGSNRYSSGNNYAKFVSSGPGNRVSDHNQPVSKADAEGTYRVTVKASVLATQIAGDYSTTLVFVCTAQY